MFDLYQDDPELASLATEGIRFHDSHTTPRNRFVDLGPVLTKKMRSIIERGIASGEFTTELNPDLIFTTASLLVSGAFTNRYVIETLGGLDTRQAADMSAWRQYSEDLILTAITRNN